MEMGEGMSTFIKRLLFAVPLLMFMTAAQAGVAVGDTPPDYLGQTRRGDDIHVSHMHGKVVIVTFWASWCQYCRKELPMLANIQKLVSPDQLQVVAINRDDRDTFIKLSRALAKATPDLIYTFDQGNISKAYDADTIPRTLLIDRDGTVAYVHKGYGDNTLDDLAREINNLLKKPAQQPSAPPS
jgi:thiol-disulfide isomerase/thioredoxin